MDPQAGFYIFSEPTFVTEQECITSISNPIDIQMYIEGLKSHYGDPAPQVRTATCVTPEKFKELMEQMYGVKDDGIPV